MSARRFPFFVGPQSEQRDTEGHQASQRATNCATIARQNTTRSRSNRPSTAPKHTRETAQTLVSKPQRSLPQSEGDGSNHPGILFPPSTLSFFKFLGVNHFANQTRSFCRAFPLPTSIDFFVPRFYAPSSVRLFKLVKSPHRCTAWPPHRPSTDASP